MTLRLHPRSVAQLAPARDASGALTRAEYFDAEETGLSVRVTPGAARSYWYTYSRHGRTRRVRLGDVNTITLAQAREKVRELRAQIQLDRADPAAVRAEERRQAQAGGALTVARLIERCLASLTLRPATRTEWERLARVEIGPRLGARPAAGVTRGDVRAMLGPIVARAPYIANRTYELLRRAYSWGMREDLLAASPCAGMGRPAEERASERVLARGEVLALLRALDALGPGTYTDAVRLLLLTGVREGNVLGMARSELLLDTDTPRWIIPGGRMKAAHTHVVPLVPQALAIVERRLALTTTRGRGDGDLLFPAGRGVAGPAAWSSRFRSELRAEVDHQAALLAQAGAQIEAPLPRWTVHGLRHTLATHMREELRVSRDTVGLILAHRPRGGSAATARYDRSELLDERRAALVAWAAWLDRLAAGSVGGRVLPLGPRDPRAAQADAGTAEAAEEPSARRRV